MSVPRSASGDGLSPARSSFASTKRSIGLRHHPGSTPRGLPDGRAARTTSARSRAPPRPPSASGARSARLVSCRRDLGGGITSSGSSEVIRAISSLSSGSSGHDDAVAAAVREHVLSGVEPKVPLAAPRVGPVALEAVLGQDRPDLSREVDLTCASADAVQEAQECGRGEDRHEAWDGAVMRGSRMTRRPHAQRFSGACRSVSEPVCKGTRGAWPGAIMAG